MLLYTGSQEKQTESILSWRSRSEANQGTSEKGFAILHDPHSIQKTEKIPLNKNGKTDRRYFMELEVGT